MEEVGCGLTGMAWTALEEVGFGLTGMVCNREVGFGLTGMDWNGGSWFWPYWNGLD
jgi:hypothetical protein